MYLPRDFQTVKAQLNLVFCIRRFFATAFISYFAPSITLVAMAGMAILIGHRSAPARSNYYGILILSAVKLLEEINELLEIGYVTALDVYVIVSLLFILVAVLEFALAHDWLIKGSGQYMTLRTQILRSIRGHLLLLKWNLYHFWRLPKNSNFDIHDFEKNTFPKKYRTDLARVARFEAKFLKFYFGTFFAFNVVYWIYVIYHANEYPSLCFIDR